MTKNPVDGEEFVYSTSLIILQKIFSTAIFSKMRFSKKYTGQQEKRLTVDVENLIKIAIHNFEK